jgi:hypothetical protein
MGGKGGRGERRENIPRPPPLPPRCWPRSDIFRVEEISEECYAWWGGAGGEPTG